MDDRHEDPLPNDDVLRRSLDAVDRHRNRLLIGMAVTIVLLLFAFTHGAQAIHAHDTLSLMHAVMLVLAIWMTLMTLTIVIQITVMTKRILRAIELAAKK